MSPLETDHYLIDLFHDEIEKEHKRQRRKYGTDFCEGLSPETWALILAEETGEVADAVLKLLRLPNDFRETLVSNAKTECVHAATSALSTYIAICRWEREKRNKGGQNEGPKIKGS